MPGINRALRENTAISKSAALAGKPCIFLSHISIDLSLARRVGKYITDFGGIDIYLDADDADLQRAVVAKDAVRITAFIERGLSSSTNLLCLLTQQTVNSWWVPYEIGYTKSESKHVATLKLKGQVELPEYLKIGQIILGTKSLNEYLGQIRPRVQKALGAAVLLETLMSHAKQEHPLDNVLDWNA